ncbi:MAG: hypothetical protein LBR29_10350 [Methylobacteriaceae bacterium]|jgi:hypothetical protein|nr:hypothetical protein [Methylobacteriaceae bacterium]
MTLPKLCLLDTNVPVTANLAARPEQASDVPDACVLACIEAVEHVVKTRGLVIDDGDEILAEYRKHLHMRGQPGVGDKFVKWIHDHCWRLPASQKVHITKNGESYHEFPAHEGLKDFDISDRKFVAVANAHPAKPPIVQATDSKWWGWKDALAEVGITVRFLCPDYSASKFTRKMGP